MIHFLFSCTGYSSDILILYIITPLSELKQEHCMIIALVVDPGLVKGTPSMMWTDGTPVHCKNPYIHTFSLILLTNLVCLYIQ